MKPKELQWPARIQVTSLLNKFITELNIRLPISSCYVSWYSCNVLGTHQRSGGIPGSLWKSQFADDHCCLR
jgi:hypothetical protein